MLFTLKKIISAFFMPMSIGLILFFVGLIFLLNNNYKRAKQFLLVSFIWIVLISYSPFSTYLIQPLEQKYKSYIKVDKDIKYVLVLGSSHASNDEISKLSQLSKTALMRLGEGIRIYRELDNAKLIVSGYGGTDKVPHALVSKDVAVSLGVPTEDILTQEEAKDTEEEAIYAKKTIKNDKFILVTSASHMPRAIKIFNSKKMKPIPAPTDYLSKDDGKFNRVPKAKEIRKTEFAMHEYLGTLWHDIKEKIRYYLN